MRRYLALALPLAILPLMGQSQCGGGDDTPAPWGIPGSDFSEMGPFAVEISADTFSAPGSCVLSYTSFIPAGGGDGPLVVLAHGFQRSQAQMFDLGEHLASYGLEVVTPNLCHSTPADNDPDQDAADMSNLATELGTNGEVLYMGHSAGGLRVVLAAVSDPRTVAALGLDLVDLNDMAADAAPMGQMPIYGVLGEGSLCNSNGNGVPVYEGAQNGRALKVTEADHCDFEGPTNALCTSFCSGTNSSFDDGTIIRGITGLATSFALWQAGVDTAGRDWWMEGGESYESLVDRGLVTVSVE